MPVRLPCLPQLADSGVLTRNLLSVFQAIPVIFIYKKGFTISQTGLIFIGVGIGTTLGSIINYLLGRQYVTLVPKWKGFPPPEKRLYSGMIGSPLLVVGCFWLGWTGNYPSVHWVVPALATICVGCGISLIFMAFLVCAYALEFEFGIGTDLLRRVT